MKTWELWHNSHPDFKYGTVAVYDEPWWLGVIGWMLEHIVGWICCDGCNPVARIPLPNWFPRKRGGDGDETLYTLRGWLGTVGELISEFIYNPLCDWHWRRHEKYEVKVEIGYDRLKELFGNHYPELFTENGGEGKYI